MLSPCKSESSNLSMNYYMGNMEDICEAILKKEISGFKFIVTPNINHIVKLAEDTDLSKSYAEAEYILLDSKVLKVILDYKGIKHGEVIPGSSLTERLFQQEELENFRVCVVGLENSDFDKLKEKYKTFNMFHVYPPFGFEQRSEIYNKVLSQIESIEPDIIFLAVGCPKQEKLALDLKRRNKISGIALCIGASLDFLIGKQVRAPRLFQVLYLEWLFRMLSNPKRLLSRYINDFIKLIRILKNG